MEIEREINSHGYMSFHTQAIGTQDISYPSHFHTSLFSSRYLTNTDHLWLKSFHNVKSPFFLQSVAENKIVFIYIHFYYFILFYKYTFIQLHLLPLPRRGMLPGPRDGPRVVSWCFGRWEILVLILMVLSLFSKYISAKIEVNKISK